MYVYFTFLNFRIEAYSAAVGSWMAKELTEDRGDLLTPLAPLPLPVTGPLMVPFPLPPFDQKDNNTYQFLHYQKCQLANPKKTDASSSTYVLINRFTVLDLWVCTYIPMPIPAASSIGLSWGALGSSDWSRSVGWCGWRGRGYLGHRVTFPDTYTFIQTVIQAVGGGGVVP